MSQALPRGSPAESAAEHLAGPTLQVWGGILEETQAAQDAVGMGSLPAVGPTPSISLVHLDLCQTKVMAGEPSPTFQCTEFQRGQILGHASVLWSESSATS